MGRVFPQPETNREDRGEGMTISKVASLLCLAEGKKSQIKIGDMREALRLLIQIQARMQFEGDVKDTPLWALGVKADELCAKIKLKSLKAKGKKK